METMTARRQVSYRPTGTITQKHNDDMPMLPDYVLAAAVRYTDMVQGKPEHWLTVDEAFDFIEKKHGWK